MWTVYTHCTFCRVHTFAQIAHFVSLIKCAHLDNFHRSPQLGGFEMKTLIRWEAKSVTEHSCHLLRFIRLSPSFLKIMIVFLCQPLPWGTTVLTPYFQLEQNYISYQGLWYYSVLCRDSVAIGPHSIAGCFLWRLGLGGYSMCYHVPLHDLSTHLNFKLVHGVVLAPSFEGGVPGEVLLVIVAQVGARLRITKVGLLWNGL